MKRPFDTHTAISRVCEAVAPDPKAAMFELADEGYNTPFEILVACIISIRTYEEVTLPCARRLFALARTPTTMSQLSSMVVSAQAATRRARGTCEQIQ